MSTSLSPSERSYIITGLSHPTHPTRLDGRPLLSPRPITISYGDAPQASGSARVVIDGGTEVVAGIRLEVTDVDPRAGKGKEGWKGRVEVDVTPQAYPQMSSQTLGSLSTLYTSMVADHFIPSLPPFPILPPTKYFVPYLHLTLLSTTSASIPFALLLAARAAFTDLRIPKIKRIGYEAITTSEDRDLSGIKAAVRAGRGGGGKVKGAVRGGGDGGGGEDWDLDLEDGDGTECVSGRGELPVLVTLNLVPGSEVAFLDASVQEESACPDRIHMFFTGSGRICGIRLEGGEGLEAERIPSLLKEGKRIAGELVTSVNSQIP